MNEKKPLRVLGIDPGLAKMGWGVIEVDGPWLLTDRIWFSQYIYRSLSLRTVAGSSSGGEARGDGVPARRRCHRRNFLR